MQRMSRGTGREMGKGGAQHSSSWHANHHLCTEAAAVAVLHVGGL